MAQTRLGRELTEEHKLAQIALVTRFYAGSLLLLGELDPSRLDATLPDWLGLQVVLAERFHTDSTRLARAYLSEFRSLETSPAQAAEMPIVTPRFDAAGVAERAAWISPMAKARTAGGLAAQAAVDEVFWALVAGWGRVGVQAGGRDLIDRSTLANPHSEGWRRVSDGRPCTWCAMLVTRGPAYRSAATAGEGRHYHDRCGCTAEEVFGTWTPTESEQRLIDLYEASHEPGMTAAQTTAAMRRNGDGVVNDAVTSGSSGGGNGGRRRPPGGGHPDDDPDWSEAERRTAAYLRSDLGGGHRVGPGGKTPRGRLYDASVDDEPTEFKAPRSGATAKTIYNAANASARRGGQARFSVFDLRNSGASEDVAREAASLISGSRYLRERYTRIRFFGDGYDFVWEVST